ncbi:ABC transporter permease [Nitrincola iocasae]|uniref:ABC transporter permease n=1 Tax=Nitrincola iocasae TaxID=2614693 RepID=A0A5J6LHI4_9GAMM|nr:ABC transporter permease [Nitrincola iocasae]QEW08150.1 ABC transporter permease [Nitrincola iocasae]
MDKSLPKTSALLAPAITIILVFLAIPILTLMTYSFLQPATYGGIEWIFSLDAYVQLFFEEDFLTEEWVFNSDYLVIILTSIMLALIATLCCLILGLPTAYFIATRPPSTRMLWLMAVIVPYCVNLLIRTISMLFIIRDQGPINSFLIWTGLIDAPLQIAYTNFAVTLGLFYSYLPFMILPIYVAVERFNFSLLTAANDLYASKWASWQYVLLPNLKPGIIAGCLLVFIPSLGAFIAPDLLGGGKQLMIGNLIALQFQGSRNWPFGAALGMVLMAMIFIVLIVFSKRNSQEARS